MSANTSPIHYEDTFVRNINETMRVPEKISFNSEMNGLPKAGWTKDNIDMQVPERILVAGNDRHVGTRAPPREIVYDKSILATDAYPGDVRVATPPRTLTLDKYPFPEFEEAEEDELNAVAATIKKAKYNYSLNDSELLINRRESPPPMGGGGDNLTTTDEVLHLRKQMAKLNRRIMALEMDNINRLQKEKFVLGFGVAYFLFKFIIWMNKD